MAGFTPVTFGGENVTPKNDGGLYRAHHSDGILWGCGMSISGSDLIINTGEFIECGRVIFIDGATTIDLSGATQDPNEYIRVIMNINLSNDPVIYTSYDESSSLSGFSTLTKDDINNNGTVYQMAMAYIEVVGGSLNSVYLTMGNSYVTAQRFESYSGNGGVYVDGLDSNIVYGTNGVYLRPNGRTDSTGQTTISPSGDISINGKINTNGNSITVGDVSSSGSFSTTGTLSCGGVDVETGGSSKAVRFTNGGVLGGSVASDGSSINISQVSGGSSIAGLSADTTAVVYANNASVVLRPKGLTNSSKQTVISNTGDMSVDGNISAVTNNLTGNIYIETNGATRRLDFTDNGTVEAELRYDGNYVNLATISGGSSKAGMQAGGTNIIYADGQNIYLRPNGISDSSGQVSVDTNGYINGASRVESGSAGMDTNTNTKLYANGSDVVVRPNGRTNTTGQVAWGTDGQQRGGHPLTTRAPGGSVSLTASMGTITSVTAGIEVAGVYLVTAECDYTPGTATAHYPQLEIQNGIKNTYYTATAGGRHFCLSGLVTGMSSIVFRGTTGTNSTGATASNITVNVVRIN